jgi:hypothetical protein
VTRTVVLSNVGVDRSPDYGHSVAKLAQENAHRSSSPDTLVLRATQVHDFAEQILNWNTADGIASIIDVPLQPVDRTEIVRLLLDLATGARTDDTQLAGPKPDRLVEQFRELVRRATPRPRSWQCRHRLRWLKARCSPVRTPRFADPTGSPGSTTTAEPSRTAGTSSVPARSTICSARR